MINKYVAVAKSGRYKMQGEYELKQAKHIFTQQKKEDCFVFFEGSEPKVLGYEELDRINRFGIVQGFSQFALFIDNLMTDVLEKNKL